MAELTVEDVELFTGGRLSDGLETQRMLAAAYQIARTHCGWHVDAVADDTVTIDSPGGMVLSLPTLKLATLTEVVEDGATVPLSSLRWSTRTAQVMKKAHAARWKAGLGIIEVTMTHGYDNPADFHQAVLTIVDRLSTVAVVAGQKDSAGLIRKKVDDVEYEWLATPPQVMDESLQSMLAPYRLILSP